MPMLEGSFSHWLASNVLGFVVKPHLKKAKVLIPVPNNLINSVGFRLLCTGVNVQAQTSQQDKMLAVALDVFNEGPQHVNI